MEQITEPKMERLLVLREEFEAKMMAKMDAYLAGMRAWRKEATDCQEATEACLESKERKSVETESVAVHEEVPKNEAAVKTVRALKKRYGNLHLDVKCRRQLQNRVQGDGGSRKKL
jgi:hypothetical protein